MSMKDYSTFPQEGSILSGKTAAIMGPCRYLISLDFDGTLRSREGDAIPAEFFQLMSELRPYGVRWGINTGRNLPELMHEIGSCLPHLPDFICTCERYAYYTNEQGTVHPDRENNERCTAHNDALRAMHQQNMQEGLLRMEKLYPKVQWRRDPADEFSVIAQDEASMDQLYPYIIELANSLDGMTLQRAGRYVRLSDARYNKGTALACVIQAWNLPEEALFIMGDGHNDIGAFRRFPQAFKACPLKSHPEVLAYAQTNSVYHSPENGVLQAIRHWSDAFIVK